MSARGDGAERVTREVLDEMSERDSEMKKARERGRCVLRVVRMTWSEARAWVARRYEPVL